MRSSLSLAKVIKSRFDNSLDLRFVLIALKPLSLYFASLFLFNSSLNGKSDGSPINTNLILPFLSIKTVIVLFNLYEIKQSVLESS